MSYLDRLHIGSSQIIFWKIEKFDATKRYSLPLSDIEIIQTTKGQHRQDERLTARFCAKKMLETDYKGIKYLTSGKPYLDGSKINLSISHSRELCGVVFSEEKEVGIDVQLKSEKIRRVAPRVFNTNELRWANDDLDKLTQLWCAKETVFKASQITGVNFIDDLVITFEEDWFVVTIKSPTQEKVYKVKTIQYQTYWVGYTF